MPISHLCSSEPRAVYYAKNACHVQLWPFGATRRYNSVGGAEGGRGALLELAALLRACSRRYVGVACHLSKRSALDFAER